MTPLILALVCHCCHPSTGVVFVAPSLGSNTHYHDGRRQVMANSGMAKEGHTTGRAVKIDQFVGPTCLPANNRWAGFKNNNPFKLTHFQPSPFNPQVKRVSLRG